MATSSSCPALVDPFFSLPVEIRLQILERSYNLTSLWSLVQASRAVSAVFDEYAVHLIETTIAAAAPTQSQALMRAVLRVRGVRGPTLEDARKVTTIDSAPLTVDDVRDTSLLRPFLALAHRIHMLANMCIDHYISASLALRPSSLVKFPPGIHNSREMYEHGESYEYEPRSTGPPSWVEEQRVIKSLWRAQLLFELKRAQQKSHLDWPAENLAVLTRSNLSTFFIVMDYELQQMLTCYEFLQQLPDQQRSLDNLKLPTAFVGVALDYVCAQQVTFPYGEDHCQQGPLHVDRPSMAYTLQMIMAQGGQAAPIPGLPFDPYRKFGFAIWDDQRMTDLGFSEPRRRAILHMTHYFFRWYSILTEEEKIIRQ